MSAHRAGRPLVARIVRVLAVPIIVFWVLVTIGTNIFVPQAERVADELAGPMIPTYAPSQVALLQMGAKFGESDSTNLTMLVLEADRPLDDGDHRYYDDLVRRLQADTEHVQYVMDLWGKPITAAAVQSVDGKAAFVMVRLAGNTGKLQANESVDAVRDIVAADTPPPGLKVYVSGAAPLASDTLAIATASLKNITILTIILIVVMLLVVYRSVPSLLVPLPAVLIELLAAKGIIAVLGHLGIIPLSSFAVNLLVALTLGAGTDYGIFLLGRYQEARRAGESREDAYFTAYRSVAPIIIGSGLTIAGACFCLSLARLDYFHTMGPAVAISMLCTIAAALTLAPALLTLGSRHGLFDPRRPNSGRLYRRIATSVVRWPKPIFVASAVIVLVGAVFVPTYRVGYDDRAYQPADAPANLGFEGADRHFPPSKVMSELLMVESDHDMRNSADFISLDRVAKALVRLPGVAMVQSITRPLGRPLEHATIPYLFTTQGSTSGQQLPFSEQQNENTDRQAEIQAHSLQVIQQVIAITARVADELHTTTVTFENLKQVTDDVNDGISNLDDFLRPLKNYFYWEPHCFDIPVCFAMRALFDSLDGIDSLDQQIGNAVQSFEAIDRLLPQMITQLEQMEVASKATLGILTNNYGPAHLQSTQTDQTYDDLINVGNDFDAARSDDFFYIPHEAFDNEDVKTGMKLLMSPDGKAARFIITHEGDAMAPEGIEHVEQFPDAIKMALKETSLAGAKVYVGGAAASTKDIRDYVASDLLIVAVAAFVLIFLIMLYLTRSLVGAMVIPSTVAFSFAGAFGLSVLVWQHVIGLPLHWLVLPLAFIILVAVGSDYNLLLISRVKEESGAGLNTGLIRALGSTGSVVTSAGLVFAVTMLSMLASNLLAVGQLGSTVCIGLLLDTMIVRSLVVPCLLRLLGPWFWWPTFIRQRPLRKA
ncbi:membrane protein, MmpL family protein [Mycolicibacterium smegmatis MKD8]|uniref:Membrane protein, MmpL family protein n=2 Tax=Mycolicibacterium smegmatis TaxID=1772 RepID=A0A2U9PS51_MYCSE|nr:membrane protein, MmpL family protein [Mycolicibacterium smegmatis MKD8]